MRILFDQGTPVPLRTELTGHTIKTVYELGWSELENGELLSLAESEGFEILLTTDNNLQYQQNLSNIRIAIVVLSSPSWPRIRSVIELIRTKIDQAAPGSYTQVIVP